MRSRYVWLLLTLAMVAAACSEAGSGEPVAPDTTTTTTTAPPTTTSPPTTTVPTTTIPATSIPPATLAPPQLDSTTTTTAPGLTTLPPDVDETTVVVAPEDDLAALVAQAAPGTQFLLLPGIHRTERVVPKDGMVFEGMEDTILNGSVLLEGFEPDEDLWKVNGPQLNMGGHGECVDGYNACILRNDLYIDDEMMWRVDTRAEVGPGKWWSEGIAVVIGDDPTGRKVEISLTEQAFRSDADDVTIRNLIIEKYASGSQGGAIQAQLPGEGDKGSNWLIEDVELRLNHGAGIRTGDGTVIRNVHAHHNGQQGITGGRGNNILIENTEINHNNLRGYSAGWEAGGVKFTRTRGLVLRGLNVHHNLGPGLWVDIDATDTTIENNTVYSNNGPGIFYEISFDAVIRDNEVYDNGFVKGVWLWGAGILVAASTDVEVYGNTVTNNADGIAGIQQRREGDNGLWRLKNVSVHDNEITMWYGQTGVVEDMGDPSVFTDRSIRFAGNTYVGAGHEAFAWGGNNLTFDEWLATGQGAGSTRSDG